MKHAKIILVIGIVLILIPVLGFPPVWNKFFVTILGVWLCGIVLSVKYGSRLLTHSTELSQSKVSDSVATPTSHSDDHTPTV
ncbi:MAG: hypothetical protein AAB511_02355 [Patescibacteria group bacterium]